MDNQPPHGIARIAQLLARRAAQDAARCGTAADEVAAAYMKPPQVARALGVSVRTVRRWLSSGQLPSARIGGTRLVAIADIERLLSRGSKTP